MVHKWDQLKSSPAYVLFSFPYLTCFVTLSICLPKARPLRNVIAIRNQKAAEVFPAFPDFLRGCVQPHASS